MNKVIYVHVETWIGSTYEAMHYYGQLMMKDSMISDKVDLITYHTQKTATQENKFKMRIGLDHFKAKAGDITTGFLSMEELEDAAVQSWKTHFLKNSTTGLRIQSFSN